MSDYLSLLMFPVLMLFILAGFQIAFSMILVASIFGLMLFGDVTAYQLLSKIEETASNSVLAAVPLFIFMGAMLEKSGIAERYLKPFICGRIECPEAWGWVPFYSVPSSPQQVASWVRLKLSLACSPYQS